MWKETNFTKMENDSLQLKINTISNSSVNNESILMEPETTEQTPRLRKSTHYYCNIIKDPRKPAPWQLCRARIINLKGHAPNEPNKYAVELKNGDSHVSIIPEYFLAYRDQPFIRSNSVFRSRVIALRDTNRLPHVHETNDDYYISVCKNVFGKFYAGIVTEQIYLNECEHFLVFFDDGHVQYVPSNKIRNVIGKFTWNGVNENLTKFIRYYDALRRIATKSYLNLNYGRLKEQEMTTVELNGRWQKATVLMNFHKMVKIQFEATKHFEWLYCESPRFENTWRMINSSRMLNECLSPDIITNDNNVILLLDDNDDEDCVKIDRKDLYRNEIVDRIRLHMKEPIQRFVPHKCNRGCLAIQEKSDEMCRANQLVRPLIAGWKVVRMNDDIVQKVAYITPCGRICGTIKDVHTFLVITDSQLGIDCFTFDSSIDCTRIKEKSPESKILAEDISMGLEYLPVQLVGHLDSGSPDPFEYITKMYLTAGVPRFMINPYRQVCCDCTDDCSDKEKCACWRMNSNNQNCQIGKNRNVIGYEYKRLQNVIIGGIYECHEGCKCKKNCFNRVAQQPLNHFLEIFKSKKCGWGLRCMNDLPKGTFVTCYFGDVLSEQNVDARAAQFGDTYLYNLNVARRVYGRPETNRQHNTPPANIEIINYFPVNVSKNIDLDDNQFVIDAKLCGNSSRFLNHSCDPNMFAQDVYIDTHDERFPRLAFFTSRNVQAGEELTIDYAYQPGSIEGRSMICECDAVNCRKRLL